MTIADSCIAAGDAVAPCERRVIFVGLRPARRVLRWPARAGQWIRNYLQHHWGGMLFVPSLVYLLVTHSVGGIGAVDGYGFLVVGNLVARVAAPTSEANAVVVRIDKASFETDYYDRWK